MTKSRYARIKNNHSDPAVVNATTAKSDYKNNHKVANCSWGVVEHKNGDLWQSDHCPKCNNDSIMVHGSGLFLCLSCAYHGNTTMTTIAYRGSALNSFDLFLKHPSFIAEPTAEFINTQGSLAPAWINNSLQNCWHSWCLSEDGKILDAVIQENSDNFHRYKWTQPCPLGWSDISGSRVVLCLDLKTYITLKSAEVKDVVAMPIGLMAELPTAKEWDVLQVIERKMTSLESIIIASKKEHHARALEDELGRRLGREKCQRVRWISPGADVSEEESDAESSLKNYGAKAVNLMISCAPPFPVIGIHELDDVSDRFDELYIEGLTPGVATGYPTLDEYYTVKTGQWTAVTGIPGHGKSTFLDAMLVNLAAMHGWRIGFFSPENQPIERHFASLMEKYIGKPFSEGPTKRISPVEKNSAKRWLNDRFKMVLPDEENGIWTLDAVLNLAKILVYRYGIRGFVIDPWNELDHSDASSMRETDHISESLTKVRRFARMYDVHVWIVAHPTKLLIGADGKYPVPTPYNISGGAQWRNKADNCITVFRNVDEDDKDIADIHIQKIRFKEVGRLGRISLRSDIVCGRYIDDIDQVKREMSINKGLHTPSSNIRIKQPRQYEQKVKNILEDSSDF